MAQKIPVYESPENIKAARSEIASMESMLNSDVGKRLITDPAQIQTDIRRKKQYVKEITPPKLNDRARSAAYDRLKVLAENIHKEMVPPNAFYSKPKSDDDTDFNRAVDHQVKYQTNKNVQKMSEEYKALARQVDPDDNTLPNLEQVRRGAKITSFLSPQGKDNYENINWNIVRLG